MCSDHHIHAAPQLEFHYSRHVITATASTSSSTSSVTMRFIVPTTPFTSRFLRRLLAIWSTIRLYVHAPRVLVVVVLLATALFQTPMVLDEWTYLVFLFVVMLEY